MSKTNISFKCTKHEKALMQMIARQHSDTISGVIKKAIKKTYPAYFEKSQKEMMFEEYKTLKEFMKTSSLDEKVYKKPCELYEEVLEKAGYDLSEWKKKEPEDPEYLKWKPEPRE